MNTNAPPAAKKTSDFTSQPLPPAKLENLQCLGYASMTPIQAASLPRALAGKDLIAQAKTGGGKTAAFALALLAEDERLHTVSLRLNHYRPVSTLAFCDTKQQCRNLVDFLKRPKISLHSLRPRNMVTALLQG
jgi:superfamily II DNA/RNA helicase